MKALKMKAFDVYQLSKNLKLISRKIYVAEKFTFSHAAINLNISIITNVSIENQFHENKS